MSRALTRRRRRPLASQDHVIAGSIKASFRASPVFLFVSDLPLTIPIFRLLPQPSPYLPLPHRLCAHCCALSYYWILCHLRQYCPCRRAGLSPARPPSCSLSPLLDFHVEYLSTQPLIHEYNISPDLVKGKRSSPTLSLVCSRSRPTVRPQTDQPYRHSSLGGTVRASITLLCVRVILAHLKLLALVTVSFRVFDLPGSWPWFLPSFQTHCSLLV